MSISSALIIEPNKKLHIPYDHIPGSYSINRVTTIQSGLISLSGKHPQLVFLSASLSAPKTLVLLEALKNSSSRDLIPIIIVVDLSNKLSNILGTTWGGKIGILHSQASKAEYDSTISRVLQHA